jgi:nucleoside phosphorylase
MPPVVIITALQVEFLAVRTHLTDVREEIHPQGTIYDRGRFTAGDRVWDVAIVQAGAGNSGAGIEAERAIAYFNPNIILFVGVAGGIKDVKIGDVVVSTKVYGYESGKAGRTFEPRENIGLPAYELEQRAKAEARKDDWLKRISAIEPIPEVIVAPIAAGEKVIASTKSEIFKYIKLNCGNAVAVEMEGFGFLQAARANHRVRAIVIRGISDLIDGKAKADKNGSQQLASRHASAFAFEILAKLQLPEELKIQDNSQSSNAAPRPSPLSTEPTVDRDLNEKSTSSKIKVFISYSHINDEDRPDHRDRILELADRLRHDGIECKLDRYETSPDEGWQRWMLDLIEEANFVVVPCSKEYNLRLRGKESGDKGKGSIWESNAILQELYDKAGKNSKFIPIVFSEDGIEFIPTPLGSATYYNLEKDNGYERLYRRLTAQPDTPPSPLGTIKVMPPRERKSSW